MSDILDLITRIADGPERRIGFGQPQESSSRQLPILIAIAGVEKSQPALSHSDAVASIVPNLTALKKQLGNKHDLPWGIWDGSNIDKLISKICETDSRKPDFIAFSAEILSLELIQEPDIAKILRIPLSISTDSLFSMSSIPVDAVTVCVDDTAKLSLEMIGRIATIRSIFDKPLLLELCGEVSVHLLTIIKDLGIEGVAIDATNDNSTSISTIKELLTSIPKKDPRSDKRRPNAAIAGALSYSVTADENEELE